MKRALSVLSAAFTGVLFVCLFFIPVQAHAMLLFSDTDVTTGSSNVTTQATFYLFSTTTYATQPPAFTISSADLFIRGCIGFGCDDVDVYLTFEQWNGTAYETVATSSTEAVNNNADAPLQITFDFTPFNLQLVTEGETFQATAPITDRYWFKMVAHIDGGLADGMKVWGHDPGSFIGDNTFYDGSIAILYATEINGDSYQNTNTRIIQRTSPVDGSTTPTSQVTFSYDYFFNDNTHFGVLDQACIQVTNVSIGQTLVPVCETISASGQSTFSEVVGLTQEQSYIWKPYLTSSTTTAGRIYGTGGWFDVVQAPVTQSLIPPTDATSTPAIQSFFNGMQNIILGVPPFSYWVQVRSIMASSTSLLTGTSTLPVFVFQVGATTTPIHVSINVFTAESVTKLIPQTFWDSAKVLMGLVMWVMFGLMIYHEVDRRFSRAHS